MKPWLWGPPVWHALFTCAIGAKTTAKVKVFNRIVFNLLTEILPCPECRQHYVVNLPRATKRAGGKPKTAAQAFRLMWFLKDEVNRSVGRISVPFEHIHERYHFHGDLLDEVALGDALVLTAIAMQCTHREDEFVEFCDSLYSLIPFPEGSGLGELMCSIQENGIVADTVNAANAARIERGMATMTIADYKSRMDGGVNR